MINLVAISKVYGSWAVTGSQPLSKEDKEAISSATVVDSQFGKSVMFTLKAGGSIYQPLSNRREDEVTAGQVLNLDDLKLITLSKQGEADIYRIDW